MTSRNASSPTDSAWRAQLRTARSHWTTAWLLLSLPGLLLLPRAVADTPDWPLLLHVTGELSVRLLVLTLLLTPLVRVFPRSRWLGWLRQRRRWLGVASFGYAAAHAVVYVVSKGVLFDIADPAIALGWLAFAVLIVLAATSNDTSVRALGPRWSRLQRWSLVAAGLSALHWVLLDLHIGSVLVHFTPLVVARAGARWRPASIGRDNSPMKESGSGIHEG